MREAFQIKNQELGMRNEEFRGSFASEHYKLRITANCYLLISFAKPIPLAKRKFRRRGDHRRWWVVHTTFTSSLLTIHSSLRVAVVGSSLSSILQLDKCEALASGIWYLVSGIWQPVARPNNIFLVLLNFHLFV